MACQRQGPLVKQVNGQWIATISCTCGVAIEVGSYSIGTAMDRAKLVYETQLKGRHNE